MKKLLLLGMVGLLGACSSNGSRSIASIQQCEIEKHKNSHLYRIMVDGNPYNKFWYKKGDAEDIIQRLADKGKCD